MFRVSIIASLAISLLGLFELRTLRHDAIPRSMSRGVGDVSIDILGQKIPALLSERVPTGIHRVEWNGRDDSGHEVSSGLYFIRVGAGNQFGYRKVVYLK